MAARALAGTLLHSHSATIGDTLEHSLHGSVLKALSA